MSDHVLIGPPIFAIVLPSLVPIVGGRTRCVTASEAGRLIPSSKPSEPIHSVTADTAWVGIDDAGPALDQESENCRLVQLRLREGAATSAKIADAPASLTRAQ